ncbi:uncharacterized protein LOC134730988 [Pan paniscus]|uniref:uncharacterized protein LOC134730988 n=1 Tax=Pan paniscus TaxID=9597 RepID=UPI00300731B2
MMGHMQADAEEAHHKNGEWSILQRAEAAVDPGDQETQEISRSMRVTELESSLERRLLLFREQRFQGRIKAGILIAKVETKESIPDNFQKKLKHSEIIFTTKKAS